MRENEEEIFWKDAEISGIWSQRSQEMKRKVKRGMKSENRRRVQRDRGLQAGWRGRRDPDLVTDFSLSLLRPQAFFPPLAASPPAPSLSLFVSHSSSGHFPELFLLSCVVFHAPRRASASNTSCVPLSVFMKRSHLSCHRRRVGKLRRCINRASAVGAAAQNSDIKEQVFMFFSQ